MKGGPLLCLVTSQRQLDVELLRRAPHVYHTSTILEIFTVKRFKFYCTSGVRGVTAAAPPNWMMYNNALTRHTYNQIDLKGIPSGER